MIKILENRKQQKEDEQEMKEKRKIDRELKRKLKEEENAKKEEKKNEKKKRTEENKKRKLSKNQKKSEKSTTSRLCSNCLLETDDPQLGLHFELKCPESAHRQLRAKEYCSRASISKYYCLYDENYKQFVESCQEEPDHVRPGEKYVITGRRRNVNCSSERLQPFLFWSNTSSVCVYIRSQCNDIGQILYNKGSNKIDKSCRCDYRKGYDFIARPKNSCFCKPAQEDCSCYLTNCSRHLTPGILRMFQQESNHVDTLCPPILLDSNDEEHNTYKTIHIEEKKEGKNY
ncbi:unnamed protein product [Mytilus coruscus]|uniref:Uncharacterized protein n=1 Tax=Mytilus coruscus TaxID=42192 RepID=A0A6J8A0F7_MYTCO|nr:unnamed protein product [Mytilus coruscus]